MSGSLGNVPLPLKSQMDFHIAKMLSKVKDATGNQESLHAWYSRCILDIWLLVILKV